MRARAASGFGEFPQGSVARTLRRCRTFDSAPAAAMARVAAITVLRSLAKGDYLFHQGAPVHGFYIVERGAIKVHRVNSAGKEQVLHIFRPTESFGEESLMSENGYAAEACATEGTKVLLVPRRGFVSLLGQEPELALCLLRAMSGLWRLWVGLLDDLTLKDVKTRLADWLLRRCPDPASRAPYPIRLPGTKRVLAAELGAASETLSRAIAQLRALRLVAVQGNTLTLLCPRELARFIPHPLTATSSRANTETH